MRVNSILDDKYTQYFGFTSDELREITEYYGVEEKDDEIRSLHGGHHFGKIGIYTPQTVMNCLCNNCDSGEYDRYIQGLLTGVSEEIREQLNDLLCGKTITALIDTSGRYLRKTNPSSFFSTLFFSGYLKILKAIPSVTGDLICEVTIPTASTQFFELLSTLKLP